MNRSARKLLRLREALGGRRKLLVLTHDNPDPDSIASAWILGRIARRLGVPRTALGYGGIVGRTENRAMIDVLRIPLRPVTQAAIATYDAIALVDTQPRAGNNSLPAGRLPDLVFDHHPCRRATRDIAFSDVREEYGATTTILYEYLAAAGLPADRRMATAVFHAIRSETQNLGREAGRPDAKVFLSCFPLVDNQALSRIEHAPLTRGWFAMIDRAIDGTHLHGGVAVTRLGRVDTPDMVAQFADLVVRLEGIDWALCIGRFRSDLLLSIRTNRRRANAGKVIRGIVSGLGTAGGHDMIAGGKIAGGALTPGRGSRVEALLVRRLLKSLGASGVRPSHLTRSMPG